MQVDDDDTSPVEEKGTATEGVGGTAQYVKASRDQLSAACGHVMETPLVRCVAPLSPLYTSASKGSIRRFVITEKAPTNAFSWLKAAITAFTFKTLLRHYAKRALTPR